MLIPIIFHKIFLNSSAVISFFANGILLLLLLTRPGAQLGNYRVLLAIFAVTDIFISVFHAWYIPMFVLGDYGYIFFGYGTLRKRGILASNAILIYCSLFYTPFCLLCLHFIYRYLSLSRSTLVKERFSLFLLCCTLYTVHTLASGFLCWIGSNQGIPTRFQGELDEYNVVGQGLQLNLRSDDNLQVNINVILILCACAAIGGHTVIISLFCIRKIAKAFNNLKLDINTRRLHLNLFRALVIQFTIPVVFSLVPFSAIVLLPATGIRVGQWGNIFSLLASVFPVLDPILIILSLGRFRTTLLTWVDLILGRTAIRNEQRAFELSKAHYSMKIKKISRSL